MLDFYFLIHHEFLLTFYDINYDIYPLFGYFLDVLGPTTPFVHFLGLQTGDCGFKVDYT